MNGFHHIPEGLLLASILATLGAIVFPKIAARLGYHPALGGLGILAIFAIYFILDHFFSHQEEGEATGARGSGPGRKERLAITAREQDGIMVLDANGILGLETWQILDRQLMALLNAGKKSIILSLANVRHIDASGLGTLIRSREKARAAGAEIKFTGPRGQVREALELSGLAGAIEIFANVNEALEALRKRPGP